MLCYTPAMTDTRFFVTFGNRVTPQIRFIKNDRNLFLTLGTNRTRRAAFRAARALRAKGEKRPLRVWKLTRWQIGGRAWCHYGIGVRV